MSQDAAAAAQLASQDPAERAGMASPLWPKVEHSNEGMRLGFKRCDASHPSLVTSH